MSKKIIGVTVGTPMSPSYLRDKLNPVTSVNGVTADENGNVEITIPDSGGNVELDTTLTQSGKAADAKAVGDKFSALSLKQHTDGLVYIFINGKPVGSGLSITTVPGDIQITDIVSYYREPTMAVADEVNALDENWVSFIAITDTHTEWNKNNSQNIIRYLLKNTSANKVFHLGDISDSYSESEYKAWFAPFENCMHQLFFAKGNHEPSNPVAVYEDILADKVYLVGKPESFYYYFDDNARKVRYMVINTSDGGTKVVSGTQLAWIQESVQLPSEDWKLVALGHIDINPNDPISSSWVISNAEQVVNAFSSTNGKFVGYFCGHEHHDRIVFINETIYQTILINDSCLKDTEYANWENPDRTAGTTSEHAVSVVSFNTVTGAVDIRRIGVGSDMAYNYLTQTEEPDTPDEPEKTLTSISATYSGGAVTVGTAVTALTGVVVTAHYSDGSTAPVTGYTLSGTIAEGSNTITVSYEGMTTTFVVVGVAESGGNENSSPVIDLALTGAENGAIVNNGTGGSTYDANIVLKSGSYESNENGLVLNKNAYATISYPLTKTAPFTICIKGAYAELSNQSYQQLWRTETENPSVYYDRGKNPVKLAVKLSGAETGWTDISQNIQSYDKVCYPMCDPCVAHTYVWTGDVSTDKISFYVDGVLFARQTMSLKADTTTLNIGDSDGRYYANKITISDFRVWNRALTDEQVATL